MLIEYSYYFHIANKSNYHKLVLFVPFSIVLIYYSYSGPLNHRVSAIYSFVDTNSVTCTLWKEIRKEVMINVINRQRY